MPKSYFFQGELMKLAAIVNASTLKILNDFNFKYSFEHFDKIFYLNPDNVKSKVEMPDSSGSVWCKVSYQDDLLQGISEGKIDYVCNLAIADELVMQVSAISLLSLLNSPKQLLGTLENPHLSVIIPADCLSSNKTKYANNAQVAELILKDENVCHNIGIELGFPFGGVFLSDVDFYFSLNRPIKNDLGKEHDVFIGHKVHAESKTICLSIFDDISLSKTQLIKHISKRDISQKENRCLYLTHKDMCDGLKELESRIDIEDLIQSPTNRCRSNDIFYWMNYGLLLNQDLVNWFNTSAYEYDYHEMLGSSLNPLSHYFIKNDKAKLLPSNVNYSAILSLLDSTKIFNEKFYLKENPDVARSGMNAIEHFVKYGWKEFRDPSDSFELLKYYQDVYKIKHYDFNPLVHYSVWSSK